MTVTQLWLFATLAKGTKEESSFCLSGLGALMPDKVDGKWVLTRRHLVCVTNNILV